MNIFKTLQQSDRAQSLAWFVLFIVVGLLLWLGVAPAPLKLLVDDIENDGPNAVGLDDITQNYYDALLEPDREPQLDLEGPLGNFLRAIRGKSEKSQKGTWVSIAVLGATNDYEGGFMTHDLKPNLEVIHKGTLVKTNRWGHRDSDDYGKEKPEGTFRIALIGGSNTMGSGVDIEDTLATLIEQRLNEELGGTHHDRYEIVNLAVSAYHLLDRLWAAMYVAPEFNPDLILVSITARDLRRAVHRGVAERLTAGRDLHYDFIKTIVAQSGAQESNSELKAEQRLKRYSDNLITGIFQELNRFSDESGIPVGMLVLRLEINAVHPDLRWQAQASENAGLITLPIFEAFEGGDESMYLSDRDFHPSTKAHKLLADDIYQQLLNHDQVAPLLQP
ncbi:MAG: SGNH/GDSL hydrolase family protein [Deltaproteobacteria bacterium]|nr:SGNH/GDSL hydrolase family protein [Deltaproteobacteria bacterium]